MNDLSLHILDIAQNSIKADASEINISIYESTPKNLLEIIISDNGRGMEEETLQYITNPFYTTRTERKVGLGLSFLEQSAEQANGKLTINSHLNKGTKVHVSFELNHIDRPKTGDLPATLITLFSISENTNLYFKYVTESEEYSISTKEIKEILIDIPINQPKILKFLKEMINEGMKDVSQHENLLFKTTINNRIKDTYTI